MVKFNSIEIEKSLEGISFPTNREAILEHASKNNADQTIIDVLTMLLPGIYNTLEEILLALENIDGAKQGTSEEID